MFIPLITKVESTNSTVKITLDNGVELYVSSNHGYLHLHFCKVELPLKIGHYPSIINAQTNNSFDCMYEKLNKD